MTDFKHKIMDFLRDEEGLETVEYAVAGSLIVAGTVAAFQALGGQVSAGLTFLGSKITTS